MGTEKPKTETKKKTPVAVTVAWIGVIGVVLGALVTVGGSLLPKQDAYSMGGVGLIHSTKELNTIVTARWMVIDAFLKDLTDRPELDISDRQQVTSLRERVRAKHELHAAALKEEKAVLAHERLRELQAALKEIDDYLQVLRSKYPTIAASLPAEDRELFKEGVERKVSYQTEKEGLLQRIKRWLVGE